MKALSRGKKPDTLDRAVGSVFKDEIRYRGKTVKEVAEELYISHKTMYTWINGERRWALANAVELADYLGVNIGAVITTAKERMEE